MATIGFYIPESERDIEHYLRSLDGGERSRYILECIKRASVSVIEEKIEFHKKNLVLWEDAYLDQEKHTKEVNRKMEDQMEQSKINLMDLVYSNIKDGKDKKSVLVWSDAKPKQFWKSKGFTHQDFINKFNIEYEKYLEEKKKELDRESKQWYNTEKTLNALVHQRIYINKDTPNSIKKWMDRRGKDFFESYGGSMDEFLDIFNTEWEQYKKKRDGD